MKQTPNFFLQQRKLKPNSTIEVAPQPTKHKPGFQKTYANVVQDTKKH